MFSSTDAEACSITQSSAEGKSVYQRVLGKRFRDLHPRLQHYFGPIPNGQVGRGHGTYEVAGSRHRFLWPLLQWMAWRHILFPELDRNVPFTVVNMPSGDGTLTGLRTFSFARRTRVMEDAMSVVDGQLIDRLGKRRGLEVTLDLSVLDGDLHMESRRFWLRLRGLRVPLPPVATLSLFERVHPSLPERQQVDVRITAPLVGEVFRYSGSFTYHYEPDMR